MKLTLTVCAALVACAATVLPSGKDTNLAPDLIVRHPIILPDGTSQALFNDALRWSRENHLETGGCFSVYRVVGDKIIVTDAIEKVYWRREDKVLLQCAPRDGIWHTHWKPEDKATVGCNVKRAADLYLINEQSVLGLIICGIGRDSIKPYDYDEQADSTHEEYLRQNPAAVQQERRDALEEMTYTCANEPPASRRRPTINCRK